MTVHSSHFCAPHPFNERDLSELLSELVKYNVLSINPREALRLGQGKTPEGIPRIAYALSGMLAEAIGKDPEYSFEAGKTWPEELYDPNREIFIRQVVQHPLLSALAGEEWPAKRSAIALPELAAAVLRDPKASRIAGERWDDKHYLHIREHVGIVIAKSAEESYMAGLHWVDDRYDPFAEIFEQAVTTVPLFLRLSLGSEGTATDRWSEERRRGLEKLLGSRSNV